MSHTDLTDDEREKKLSIARSKYGRELFAHEIRVERKTKPSYVLEAINRKTEEAKRGNNIVNIQKVKR